MKKKTSWQEKLADSKDLPRRRLNLSGRLKNRRQEVLIESL
jgi:hypothetical protein